MDHFNVLLEPDRGFIVPQHCGLVCAADVQARYLEHVDVERLQVAVGGNVDQDEGSTEILKDNHALCHIFKIFY